MSVCITTFWRLQVLAVKPAFVILSSFCRAAFKFAGCLLFSVADYSENNNIKILCLQLEKRDDDDADNKSSNDLVLLFNSKQQQPVVRYCALDPS